MHGRDPAHVTKHSILVRSVDELADAIHTAFAIARGGRPGPVDRRCPQGCAAGQHGTAPARISRPASRPTRMTTDPRPARGDPARAAALIATAPSAPSSSRAMASSSPRRTRNCANSPKRTNIPVVSTTLLGISAFPESHPLATSAGPACMGAMEVNQALHHMPTDVIIAVGMRFDDRVTGNTQPLRTPRPDHPHRHRPFRDGQGLHPYRADGGGCAGGVALSALLACVAACFSTTTGWQQIRDWRKANAVTETAHTPTDANDPAPQPFAPCWRPFAPGDGGARQSVVTRCGAASDVDGGVLWLSTTPTPT